MSSLVFDMPPEAVGALCSRVAAMVLAELDQRESVRPERWLSDEEVKHYASVSRRTARRWRREGVDGRTLPYTVIRGVARVRLSDLEAFLSPP